MTDLEFHPEAVGFEPANARWLCDAVGLLAGGDAVTVRRALAGRGLSRFAWFSQQDARALVAGGTKVVLLVFHGPDHAAVLRRRLADEPQQFASTSLGRVNAFIWQEFSLIRTNVLETVAAMRDARQRIWLAGHGIGGAFAALAAGLLETELQVPVQGVVTFGAPRVGHREYASAYHQLRIGESTRLLERTVRIVNAADPLTAVPSTIGDYAAIGLKRHFDESGRLLETIEADREVMAGLVATAQLAAGENDAPELTDHALASYVRLMRNQGGVTSEQHS